MSLGHSPGVEPHKPDMKKAESEVTAQEKEEARRRIEGANAPDARDDFPIDVDDHVGGDVGQIDDRVRRTRA